MSLTPEQRSAACQCRGDDFPYADCCGGSAGCCCIPDCCPSCQCHLVCEAAGAAACDDLFCYVHLEDE